MITEKELLDAGFKIDREDPQFKYWKETKFEYDMSLLDPPVIVYDTIRNRFALYDGGEMYIYTTHVSIESLLKWVSEIVEFDFN